MSNAFDCRAGIKVPVNIFRAFNNYFFKTQKYLPIFSCSTFNGSSCCKFVNRSVRVGIFSSMGEIERDDGGVSGFGSGGGSNNATGGIRWAKFITGFIGSPRTFSGESFS